MVRLKRVEIVGAGPAGLYSAILIKSALPDARVRVTEQNPADATFGFGVVFSDSALDFLQTDDAATHALITPQMERWRNITLSLPRQRIMLDGIGFSAIGRLCLLRLLQQRALETGVELRYDHPLQNLAEVDREADLVVGADGLNSLVRHSDEAAFAPAMDTCGNHFAWFGTSRPFDSLTQTFIVTPRGPLNAHHYRYDKGMSTFIVECDHAGYVDQGFDDMDEKQTAQVCASLFADALQGAPLVANRSIWRRFPRLWCQNWVAGKRVLLGDAAHTAHFSIGSGTRLALEDAIALVKALRENSDLDTALTEYQQQRQPIARKIVDAAVESARWYDDFRARMALPPLEFAFSYLTRSGRVDMERLRRLSPAFIAEYERSLDPPA